MIEGRKETGEQEKGDELWRENDGIEEKGRTGIGREEEGDEILSESGTRENQRQEIKE